MLWTRISGSWILKPFIATKSDALRDYDLYRIRGVPGVEWAVPLYKGTGRAKGPDGRFRTVILMGVDDATLVGAPRKMLVGSIYELSARTGRSHHRQSWI